MCGNSVKTGMEKDITNVVLIRIPKVLHPVLTVCEEVAAGEATTATPIIAVCRTVVFLHQETISTV